MVVVRDVNDNAPVFVGPSVRAVVNVSEDEPVGYPVATVFAEDRDFGANGRVRYTLVSGNERGHFQLDHETGKWFVVTGTPLYWRIASSI